MKRRILFLALLASLAVCVPAQAAPPYVQATGQTLTLNGSIYRPRAINDYNLNSNGTCDPVTDDALAHQLAGATLKRAWFFQPQASDAFGNRDWSRFDDTIAKAKTAGVKLLPTLANHWSDCDGHGTRDESWYSNWVNYSYLPSSPGMAKSFTGWVAEITARYKDEDAIAGWVLINEPESPDANGVCTPTSATSLRNFAISAASVAQSNDPNHLVFFGVSGRGECGARKGVSFDQYKDLHASAYIDGCTYHDYNDPNTPIPDDGFNRLRQRINACAELGKPIIVTEAGIETSVTNGDYQARANLFANKCSAQYAAGVDWFFKWEYRASGSSSTGFAIGPGDPALSVC